MAHPRSHELIGTSTSGRFDRIRRAVRTSLVGGFLPRLGVTGAALAYSLLEAMPRLSLKGTALTRANAQTIRLKLIKVGALITRKKSAIPVHLPSQHPVKDLFARVAASLLITPGVVLPRDQGLKLRVPHRKLLFIIIKISRNVKTHAGWSQCAAKKTHR